MPLATGYLQHATKLVVDVVKGSRHLDRRHPPLDQYSGQALEVVAGEHSSSGEIGSGRRDRALCWSPTATRQRCAVEGETAQPDGHRLALGTRMHTLKLGVRQTQLEDVGAVGGYASADRRRCWRRSL